MQKEVQAYYLFVPSSLLNGVEEIFENAAFVEGKVGETVGEPGEPGEPGNQGDPGDPGEPGKVEGDNCHKVEVEGVGACAERRSKKRGRIPEY